MVEKDTVLEERMSHIAHRYLVLSGKGGVGKSTVAANVAVALARTGKKVGLLDVDLHGPSIPALMGVETQELHSDGNAIQPVIAHNVKVVSVGFMCEKPEDAIIWRGPMKYNVIKQFLRDVQWEELDALIVDAPPGTGDEPLSIGQLIGRPASAIIVTTPQKIAINDVRRCITFCNRIDLPVAGIIENMSAFPCPHCGKEISLFPGSGGADLSEETDVRFLGKIPFAPVVAASGEEGRPFASEETESIANTAFDSIVKKLIVF